MGICVYVYVYIGMDYIVFMLLGFQTEAEAFWTLCVIVEQLLASDFYSPPPAMMTGSRSLSLSLSC